MQPYSAGHGAQVVWCLRRRSSHVRCVAFLTERPIQVRVLQDDDPVITEQFHDPADALEWAARYGAQLKEHGWAAIPNPDPRIPDHP